jgi:hypothetical protein
MKKLSRREAMGTIGAAGAGVTLAGMTGAAAQTLAAPAFSGQHQIKPLPFNPAKLKGISEKLIRSHHENNYSGGNRRNSVDVRPARRFRSRAQSECLASPHSGSLRGSVRFLQEVKR